MSIWTYSDLREEDFPYGVKAVRVREGTPEGRRLVGLYHEVRCPFCNCELVNVASEDKRNVTPVPPRWPEQHEFQSLNIDVCPACGWWKAQRIAEWINPAENCFDLYQGTAALKNLDVADIEAPLDEIRDYLTARYDQRFEVAPKKFEEVVASVFKGLGYDAIVTGHSGDGGIDVILGSGSSRIGVQVKRYKGSIEVEQIRSLVGALVLDGMTRGIFVTTSRFQSGADSTAERYLKSGYRVELYDAQRFYDALQIAQRTMYRSKDEINSVGIVEKLPLIRHVLHH